MIRRALVAVVLLAACDPWTSSTEDGLEVRRATLRVGSDGRVVARVGVDDEDKALITAVTDDGSAGWVGSVEAPGGDEVYTASDWWSTPYGYSNMGFASPVVVGNWPVTGDDPPLAPGDWAFELRTRDPGVELDVAVVLGRDAGLTSGELRVEVVYADDLEAEASLRAGVTDALGIWADELYGPVGLDVVFSERDWDGPDELASPGYGDADAYLDAVAGKPVWKVTVLVVRLVTDVDAVLGVAGGIPGPLVATDRSVVVVSAEEAAGATFTFDEARTRLLAETLAHEVGHYLGLYHPVEIPTSGDDAVRWDALPDTPECARFDGDCAELLGGNLMYPTPLCAGGSCTSQAELTPLQVGVAQRYTGVR